jgi:hydrogenase maturation protease
VSETIHSGTLIAGIGNIFLGDDGFGCAVVRELERMDLPAEVKVVDYGIRGLDLAYSLLEPYSRVIFVDAISRGGAPGTVYLLQPLEPEAMQAIALDPHSMDPVRLLAIARSLGKITAEIFIVGCEPFDFGDELEGRMELSEPVSRAVPEAARAVLDLIHLTHLIQRDRSQGKPDVKQQPCVTA